MDEETGLHYFGARYYDSRVSIWLSVDPLAESFPNFNPYNYCMQNPINLVDPDGRSAYPPGGFPREDSTTHTDSDGSWIYSASEDIWIGQDGSEDYSNAIQLNEVKVLNSKYNGYLSGYFNGTPSGDFGPSEDPTLAYVVIGVVAAPIALEVGGAYLLGEAAIAFSDVTWGTALWGIGTNTLSQGIANLSTGNNLGDINTIEALFSAVPGLGSTVVGEYLSLPVKDVMQGEFMPSTPSSFEQGFLQIGGGLFSNKFSTKMGANPLFGSGVQKTYKKGAEFMVETGTNVFPGLAD